MSHCVYIFLLYNSIAQSRAISTAGLLLFPGNFCRIDKIYFPLRAFCRYLSHSLIARCLDSEAFRPLINCLIVGSRGFRRRAGRPVNWFRVVLQSTMLLPATLHRTPLGLKKKMTHDSRDKIHRVMPRRELKRSSARRRSVIIAVRLILAPSLLIANPAQQNRTHVARYEPA